MAARAIWKGVLRLEAKEAIVIPVKFFTAAADRRVHFRLMHAADGVPVKQRLVDSETREPIDSKQVTKAMKLDDDLVELDAEELAADAPEASRDVDFSRFVPAAAIDVGWYDRPYHLAPDGDEGVAGYHALVKVLADGEQRGIAHWVMRKKRYHGALEARHGRLVMVTLRPAEQVVPASALKLEGGPTITAAEKKLAEQLVSSLDSAFEPESFHDEYAERILKMVRAKAKGHAVKIEKEEAPAAKSGSMLEALKASLGHAKKGRKLAS